MNNYLRVAFVLVVLFSAYNIYDAIRIPISIWHEAKLFRIWFLLGFIILGPVSVIIGLTYWLHYRRRMLRVHGQPC